MHAIVTDEEFGRFSLRANQVAPFNAFLNLARLQKQLGETNRANLLLVPQAEPPAGSKSPDESFQRAWSAGRGVTLADAELELRELPGARPAGTAHRSGYFLIRPSWKQRRRNRQRTPARC